MGKSKRKPSSPFCVDKEDNKYVEVAALMHPIIPFIDGLAITRFGNEKKIYLSLADAIVWCEKEKADHSREKYEQILAVLRKFEAQPIDP